MTRFFSHTARKPLLPNGKRGFLELVMWLEHTTPSLRVKCSTDWAIPAYIFHGLFNPYFINYTCTVLFCQHLISFPDQHILCTHILCVSRALFQSPYWIPNFHIQHLHAIPLISIEAGCFGRLSFYAFLSCVLQPADMESRFLLHPLPVWFLREASILHSRIRRC